MRLAIIIPCYNEELTIAKVVKDAKQFLPNADIYVFDNNSIDSTAEIAKKAGAIVVPSPRQGKGSVVRHAFNIVRADVYLMLDGDDTYPLEEASKLIDAVVKDGYDMAVGARLKEFAPGAFRRFHVIGNHLFSLMVGLLFGQKVADLLSGFRAFSKNFVDHVPLNSKGFEIETDLTLQAFTKGFEVTEIPVSYRSRPEGSHSKLSTYRDGFLILNFLMRLVKDYRPLPFFSMVSGICFMFALFMGWAPITDYLNYSYVYTVPRAVLAASLMILSCIFLGVGLILDSQIRYFHEQFLLLQKMNRRNDEDEKSVRLHKAG
jgi:glycosyltransferase involved in cell wall biosynthesis